jgi:hypothetical protein
MDDSLRLKHAETQERFALLITELMDVIKKRNLPIEETISALLINTCEIARNCNVPLEPLQERLSRMYAIATMTEEDVKGMMGGVQ